MNEQDCLNDLKSFFHRSFFSERHHHSRKQMFVQHEYVHANKEYLLHR